MNIANRFCDYFTNIGPNLANNIPASSQISSSYLTGNFVNSLFFQPVVQSEITEIISSLRSGTAGGYDNIPMQIVKDSVDLVSEPLTHIVNLSIQSGIVPDQMKIARVIPIFKSGADNLFSNYRPISVLPVFSKILERVVYERLLNYLNEYNILLNNQYGFRKNHSTSLALIHLLDKITTAFDEKKYTIGIFLDLSKAFDTVDHEILFEKLAHYGIRGSALEWIKSYFTNRQQYVEFNSTCSSLSKIKCGVPQGSILGPLFFLIYINDIANSSSIAEMILFADDTNVFFSDSDLSRLITVINSEMKNLSEWFFANKLSLNIKKSNYIIFTPRQKRQTLDPLLEINNHRLERVKETSFLGVILDENLTWKSHISYVASKISKSIGIIYRSSFCLTTRLTLRTLYFALVYPYLNYCVIIWGATYPSNLNRLLLLQKKVVRILSNASYDAHTSPLFKSNKILKFEDIYLLNLGKFMFSYQNNLLPPSFSNFFFTTDQIHSHNLRTAGQFYVPFCRTKAKQFTVKYQGPKFFNSLNSEIRVLPSILTFQFKLNKYLLSLYI